MTNPLTIDAPEGLPFIDIEREFDAPVDRVFEAHRDPDLLARWMGPDRLGMIVEHHEFKTGGGFRWINRDDQGNEYAFNGVFHVVRDNEFAVQTFEFEGVPDVVSIESVTFEDLGDGRSRLRIHSVYPSLEARDGMFQSGMETGISEGYAKLDALLVED